MEKLFFTPHLLVIQGLVFLLAAFILAVWLWVLYEEKKLQRQKQTYSKKRRLYHES